LAGNNSGNVAQKSKGARVNKKLPYKRKQILAVFTLSTILIVIGAVVAVYAIFPMVNAKDTKEILNDYDPYSNKYRSYDTGDKIIITGEVSEILDVSQIYGGLENEFQNQDVKYIYILDNSLEIYTGENVARKGDTITVECEVYDRGWGISTDQILIAKTFYNIQFILIIGAIIIALGIFCLIAGWKMRIASKSKFRGTAGKISTLYSTMETKDDEAAMYRTLRAKPHLLGKKPRVKAKSKSTISEPPVATVSKPVMQTPKAQATPNYSQKPPPDPKAVAEKYRSMATQDDEDALYKSMSTTGQKK